MADNRPIGFFDSGVGLISIFKEVKRQLPKENFIILADEKHLPFGEKIKESVEIFSGLGANFLIRNHKIKLLVVACNTASVQALDHLRKYFQIPVIGTVPAVKPAYESSKNKKIVILSTRATTKSKYLENLIKQHAKDAQVLKIACPGLAEAVERLDEIKIKALIRGYCQTITYFGADSVALGCSHYPLVENYFRQYLPSTTVIVYSSQGIARKVKSDLTKMGILSEKKTNDIFYTSGNPEIFSKACSHYLGEKVEALRADI